MLIIKTISYEKVNFSHYLQLHFLEIVWWKKKVIYIRKWIYNILIVYLQNKINKNIKYNKMEIKLTPNSKIELERINNLVENEDYDYYEDFNDNERLIADAGMYESGDYCENNFISLEEFSNKISKEEGIKPILVLEKLNLMIKNNIIQVVDL